MSKIILIFKDSDRGSDFPGSINVFYVNFPVGISDRHENGNETFSLSENFVVN